jgi:hypothetical protein
MIEVRFRVLCGLVDECESRLTNRTLTTIGLHIISVIVIGRADVGKSMRSTRTLHER